MLNPLEAVRGSEGFYSSFKTELVDLEHIRDIVRRHFFINVSIDYPSLFDETNFDLRDYHQHSNLLPHSTYWEKKRRILTPELVTEFKSTTLFKWVSNNCELKEITGEDGVFQEEIYWRLVRPNCPEDVGPLHADAWFWETMEHQTSKDHERVKVWIPLYTEPGISGFSYVPGSHRTNVSYSKVYKHGKWKPQINDDLKENACIYKGLEGQPIIFNDRLIHGGVSGGTRTRVSLEFTMLCERSECSNDEAT